MRYLLASALSFSIVGMPEPMALWLGYLVPVLLLPIVVATAHYLGSRSK